MRERWAGRGRPPLATLRRHVADVSVSCPAPSINRPGRHGSTGYLSPPQPLPATPRLARAKTAAATLAPQNIRIRNARFPGDNSVVHAGCLWGEITSTREFAMKKLSGAFVNFSDLFAKTFSIPAYFISRCSRPGRAGPGRALEARSPDRSEPSRAVPCRAPPVQHCRRKPGRQASIQGLILIQPNAAPPRRPRGSGRKKHAAIKVLAKHNGPGRGASRTA